MNSDVKSVNGEVKAGSDATISCVITGLTAEATVSWLTSSGKVSGENLTPVQGTYSNGKQTSTLAVKGTQVNSDTTYTCRVTTGSRHASAHSDTIVNLNVYGIGSLTISILSLYICTAGIGIISCKGKSPRSMIVQGKILLNRK
jgi:hypothetical protein